MRLFCMCDVTHSYVWHDSFVWFVHLRSSKLSRKKRFYVCAYVWRDSFVYVMTHSYVWHDSFTYCVHLWSSKLSRKKCFSLRPCMRRDSSVCVTWFIHTRDMTHPHVFHVYGAASCRVRSTSISSSLPSPRTCVTRLIHMLRDSSICDMNHSDKIWLIEAPQLALYPPPPRTCACVCVWMCVCACVWERERKRESMCVCVRACVCLCVCMCMCVSERDREREGSTKLSRKKHLDQLFTLLSPYLFDITHTYVTWLMHMCEMTHRHV